MNTFNRSAVQPRRGGDAFNKVNRSSYSARAFGPSLRNRSCVAAATTAVAERVALNTDNIELVDSTSIPLGHLASMVEAGSLIGLQPPNQAMVFHSRKMASNLVVPVIQGRDTPPIMLEASDCGRLRVLGGTPRLTSLLAFVTGSADVGGQHWPSAPVELDARDTAFTRWNGKTFKQLPEDAKQRVSDYPITCLIVRPKPAASMT